MPNSALDLIHDAGHLDDAELIRDLDGEAPLDGAREPATHLRACDQCAARRARLQARLRHLALLLAESDAVVPGAPSMAELVAAARVQRRRAYAHTALRAAAVLLVAGALAAQPSVRRWVERQWAHAPSESTQAPNIATPKVGPDGGALSFEPGAGPFTIRFDAHPAAGTLTIIGDSGARATVERTGGADQELLVMPHALHVRNRAGGDASYVMRVPSSVPQVTVRFGDAGATVVVDVSVGSSRVVHFARVD